jgi:hypothetical protein
MTRKLRIQYPGAIYHVMNRGDRREPIFKDDRDRIARRLRKETTMTLKWIAEKLKMGTWTHVANRLHHLKP